MCPCLVFTGVESLFFELPVSVKLLRRWMTYQLLSTNLLRAMVKGGHYIINLIIGIPLCVLILLLCQRKDNKKKGVYSTIPGEL